MQVLFRAKEKNSNNYVIGYEYYNHIEDEYYITHYVSGSNYKVDRTTRSINIEDMLDSHRNKIFASLQEDGKGGDILKGQVYGISKGKVWDMVAEYKDTSIWLTRYINNNTLISMPLVYQKNGYRDMEVIGIQK